MIVRQFQILTTGQLIEFVGACKQLSIKLGKAGIFAAYEKKKVFKPKAWEICVFIPSLFGRFILYECPPIFSSVNEMKWETLLVASYSSSKQLDWIIIINKHFKPPTLFV